MIVGYLRQLRQLPGRSGELITARAEPDVFTATCEFWAPPFIPFLVIGAKLAFEEQKFAVRACINVNETSGNAIFT